MYTRRNLISMLEISLECAWIPCCRLNPTDADTAGVQYYLADQIARNFTITPDVVYEGETDKTFRVTYEADGPMYSIIDADGAVATEDDQASIEITIPRELLDRIEEEPRRLCRLLVRKTLA